MFKKSYIPLILLLSICALTSCKNELRPANILFISVDDLRYQDGYFEDQIVKTPTLNQLVKEGILFTNHYVQVPTCGASRYALITGMRPKSKKHLRNDAIEKEISNQIESERSESFIHELKRNGYYTVGIGKISHSADGLVYGYNDQPSSKLELPYSWNERLFNPGKWNTGWNAFFGYADGENRQSMKNQVKPYEKGNVNDVGYPDGLTAELAIQKLKELKKNPKPFFLGVGFFKPHLPFNAPKAYWDLYDRNKIKVSDHPNIPQEIHPKSLHNSGEFNSYRLTDESPNLEESVSDDYAKKLRHAYYASVSYIDAQIGRVLQTLKELQLEENTIVVVWGDHGWHLGDQRVWGKHTLFENALKSALIIKIPGINTKNNKISSIVETVDIYPSILELCKVEMPHPIDGDSFVDLLLNPRESKKNNNVAYSYFKNGITLRTDRYRLTKYYRPDLPNIELYDHKNDPNETENIASKQPILVKKLMLILEEGNPGIYN